MVLVSIVLVLLGVSFAIYYSNVDTANKISNGINANVICHIVSSSFDSLIAQSNYGSNNGVGASTIYTFNLPRKINNENYSIWVFGDIGEVRILYDSHIFECSAGSKNIHNSSGGSSFEMEKNATIVSNGVDVIVQ